MLTVVAANQRFLIMQDAKSILEDAASDVLPSGGKRFILGSKSFASKFFDPLRAHAEEFISDFVQRGGGSRELDGIGASLGDNGQRICGTCLRMLGMQ